VSWGLTDQPFVPTTTLKDRIAERVKHGTKPRPVAYLDYKEEEIVNFLFKCSRWGMERLSLHMVEAAARRV